MRGFESIRDQEQPIRILTTFLRDGNIPHALLFAGTKGVGKRTTALQFAMACNCHVTDSGSVHDDDISIPCGQCRTCRKIESGNHPDVIHIEPSGSLIRIAQIRELSHTLLMRPYEARIRVVILSDAQTMNPEASNALLKMLEEPPDHTVLILTTDETSNLLPTIVSRCQQIRFKPLSRSRLEEMLVKTMGIQPVEAKVVAGMANGSFTGAIEMSRAAWLAERNWLLGELESLSGKPVDHLLAVAEKLAVNKERFLYALDVMMSWLRDLAIYEHRPQRLINEDLKDRIQRRVNTFTSDALMEKIMAIEKAQKDIAANANIRLAAETLILQLSQTGNTEAGCGRIPAEG